MTVNTNPGRGTFEVTSILQRFASYVFLVRLLKQVPKHVYDIKAKMAREMKVMNM